MWANNNNSRGANDPRLRDDGHHHHQDRTYEAHHFVTSGGQKASGDPAANGNRGQPDGNKNRFSEVPRYRVVEQVAYALPVREPPVYYAGHATLPSGPPQPPPPSTTFHPYTGGSHLSQSAHQTGYPYFYGSQAAAGGNGPHQFVTPGDAASSRIGHAKVKRAPNSDCMLHDPAETLVIDYADSGMRHHRSSKGGHRHVVQVPQGSSSPSSSSRSSSMPPPKGVTSSSASRQHHHHHPSPITLSSDLHSASEVAISAGPMHRVPAGGQPQRDGYSDNHHHSHQTQHQLHQQHIHHHRIHHHHQQQQLKQQQQQQQHYYDQQSRLMGADDPDSVDGTSLGRRHDVAMARFHHPVASSSSSSVHLGVVNNFRRPAVPHGSHSSDTSSAYSGSDTMQSQHSSCENEPIDLNGLHESVVDSDEDLTDSMDSLAIRDIVRDSLEKDPVDRTEDDIDILLEFTQHLEAFNRYTMAVRRALCSVMVFAVVERSGTIVMNDKEELDSWSVIINGEVRIDRINAETGVKSVKTLKCGDAFGIEPTMEKLYHDGVMKTTQDDCQFVCITQVDYYKILNEGESNRRCYEEDGKIVLVTEIDVKSNSHKVIRGTPQRLLAQLIDENFTIDPTYVEDFLLTHRTFMTSLAVIQYLLQLMLEGKLMDRVTRVLLLWVHNHFTDFETDPEMMEYLENFEAILEKEKMNGQLRMLNFACAEKARKREVVISRPCREEKLQFTLMGGFERSFGIFVETVQKGSKASDAGLKRGDQILEVNRISFENGMTLHNALNILMETTHLQMIVKSNLLAFKELLQNPESSPRQRPRKMSDLNGLRAEYTVNPDGGSGTSGSVSGNKLRGSQPSESSSSLKSHASIPQAMTGKDKIKIMLGKLIRPKAFSARDLLIDPELKNVTMLDQQGSSDSWDAHEGPDHSLKIYKSDQQYKYLLVHQNTSAREVVMLTLQEFGITECSSNFTLCEVKVDGGFVSQKRLPDTQTNLAEKLGLGSRYYIKNVMSSEQLIPEDLVSELVKEAQVHLLQLHAMETATQLMVEDFTIFRQIETTEYVDKLYELQSRLGTPNLTRFGDLVNREMMWTITEIVSEPITARRVKLIKQFIKIAQHCYKETQNFNSMFAIVSGLDHVVVRRLKSTWDKVPAKYSRLMNEMLTVMDPSMNFRRYRNLITNARPPMIPVYPMVNKDLTFIHLGNESYIDSLVNFEKLRMLAKEIRNFNNMCSAPLDLFSMLERQGSDFPEAMRKMNQHTHAATMRRGQSSGNMVTGRRGLRDTHNAKKMFEEAQMVRRVKAYLTKMPVIENEEALVQLSLKCEANHLPSSVSLSNHLAQQPQQQQHQQQKAKSLNPSVSSSSIQSSENKPGAMRRMPSPSPSNASTTSTTSLVSEGKKSINSGAAKFGTESPKAVRKLMSLSEPGKTRRRQAKPSVSSLHTNPSPPSSPKPGGRKGHERSVSETAPPVSLSAESSSVAALTTIRKGSTTSTTSVFATGGKPVDEGQLTNSRSLPRPLPKEQQQQQQQHQQQQQKTKLRMARTLSRDQSAPNNGDEEQTQISAV